MDLRSVMLTTSLERLGQLSNAFWYTRHTRDASECCTFPRSLLPKTLSSHGELLEEPHIWRRIPLMARIVMTHDGLTFEVSPLAPY
jgi:hypothetical protein